MKLIQTIKNIFKIEDLRDRLVYTFLIILLFNKNSRHKKSPCTWQGLFRNNELAMTYSHMDNSTLPSALRGFTSEFGKGSGGSLLLLSPAQLFMTIRWVLFTHCVCLTFIK